MFSAFNFNQPWGMQRLHCIHFPRSLIHLQAAFTPGLYQPQCQRRACDLEAFLQGSPTYHEEICLFKSYFEGLMNLGKVRD